MSTKVSPVQKALLTLALGTTLLSLPALAAAGALGSGAITAGDCGTFGLRCGGLGTDTFGSIAGRILGIVNAFLFLTAAIALGFIIYGAFLYVTSRGDEDRARTAKNAIVWAIVGLIILSFAGLLVNVVINL